MPSPRRTGFSPQSAAHRLRSSEQAPTPSCRHMAKGSRPQGAAYPAVAPYPSASPLDRDPGDFRAGRESPLPSGAGWREGMIARRAAGEADAFIGTIALPRTSRSSVADNGCAKVGLSARDLRRRRLVCSPPGRMSPDGSAAVDAARGSGDLPFPDRSEGPRTSASGSPEYSPRSLGKRGSRRILRSQRSSSQRSTASDPSAMAVNRDPIR